MTNKNIENSITLEQAKEQIAKEEGFESVQEAAEVWGPALDFKAFELIISSKDKEIAELKEKNEKQLKR